MKFFNKKPLPYCENCKYYTIRSYVKTCTNDYAYRSYTDLIIRRGVDCEPERMHGNCGRKGRLYEEI
jgi:hypothetical protein